MTDPLPPTGGPPAPETVTKLVAEAGSVTYPDRWILSQPWRTGRNRSIVCDPGVCPPEWQDLGGMRDFYGGFLVLESCPLYVREYLVRLHNEGLKPKER